MCPEDPIRPDRPDGSSEFHETDYYSQFQDQNGTLSEEKPKSGGPRDEIDERTIQELMDAALQKTGAPAAPVPPPPGEILDTSVREDWAGPAQEVEPPKADSPKKRIARPARRIERPIRRISAGTTGSTPRKVNQAGSRGGWGRVVKFLGMVAFSGLFAWGVYTWGIAPRSGVGASVARAAELHAAGAYAEAAEIYSDLRNRLDSVSGQGARIAFLRGGACEQLWRAGVEAETNLENALAAYDEAVRLDSTELRVYAVEAMLAKAEMLVEDARKSGAIDPQREREGWAVLASLIDDTNYRMNPAVHHGVPHLRLAEWMREENPEAALDLLQKARDAKGELEEGLENLTIAQIYRDLLNEPDRAEEYFERVEQNELASEENRRAAEKALAELRVGTAERDGFFSYETDDLQPALESLPQAVDP